MPRSRGDIVSNRRITRPAAPNPEETETWETTTERVTAYLTRGVAPDEVGEMVLPGVKANRLYILTDRTIVGSRHERRSFSR